MDQSNTSEGDVLIYDPPIVSVKKLGRSRSGEMCVRTFSSDGSNSTTNSESNTTADFEEVDPEDITFSVDVEFGFYLRCSLLSTVGDGSSNIVWFCNDLVSRKDDESRLPHVYFIFGPYRLYIEYYSPDSQPFEGATADLEYDPNQDVLLLVEFDRSSEQIDRPDILENMLLANRTIDEWESICRRILASTDPEQLHDQITNSQFLLDLRTLSHWVEKFDAADLGIL
jgi:hypothetical protein